MMLTRIDEKVNAAVVGPFRHPEVSRGVRSGDFRPDVSGDLDVTDANGPTTSESARADQFSRGGTPRGLPRGVVLAAIPRPRPSGDLRACHPWVAWCKEVIEPWGSLLRLCILIIALRGIDRLTGGGTPEEADEACEPKVAHRFRSTDLPRSAKIVG